MRKYENIPDTLEKWKEAAKKEILRNAQINAEMPSRNTGGMPYPSRQFIPPKPNHPPRNNVATGPAPPRYVPMEVDAARLGGPLTPEERKRLFDENRCFYCRDKGHRSARCWKKPNNRQPGSTRNPFTQPTTTNPFRARAAALENFSDTTSTTGTFISQPSSSKEEITQQFKALTKEDREEFLNDMMNTEDF
jgi:flagellum-specific peptidoglycan hydrolase FlgJ